ncbi:FKBP-type peptidyl-prolyl cis-trans isomerase [Bacteroides graminisolvens]|uniref:FKBP-type peptidyl-prolyl cis-trans isomerase n=1 Tax=Bacteroides graminisolvens TaxID=477666 RepID=UPI0024098037|nr:FKBP-type peptidyl-prolyl cis-trans isomerase [Bacteroides graminisolvens]
MKKYILLSLLFTQCLLLFTSCDETEEVNKYADWRNRNEAFIDSLKSVYDAKTDPELIQIIPYAEKNYPIYAKKLKTVTSGETPLYTDSVYTYYRGMLINEAVFGAVTTPRYYTKLYQSLDVFDKNFEGEEPNAFESPTKFLVNGVVAGWREVLQRMKVGERWEVYIPWQQGYGSSVSGTIPAYSTLIFDVNLVSIIKK